MTREETAICKQIKDIAIRLGLTVESFKSGFHAYVTQYECIEQNPDTMSSCILTVQEKRLKTGQHKTCLMYYPRMEQTGSLYDDTNDKEIILPTDPYILCVTPNLLELVYDNADPDAALLNVGSDVNPALDISAVSPGKLESSLREVLETASRIDSEWAVQRIASSGEVLESLNKETANE